MRYDSAFGHVRVFASLMMLSNSIDVPFGGKKIGLVLAGGGGKGAYEIGVWRGLVEKGITNFAAISGTSIGGLNGYLVARGKLDDAEKLWRKLGHDSPLKISVLRLVLGLLERIGIAIFFASTGRVLVSLAGVLGLALTYLAWLLLSWSDFLQPARALVPMLGVVFVLLVKWVLRRTPFGRSVEYGGAPLSVRDHRRLLLFIPQPWMSWLFALAVAAGLPLWMLWRDAAVQHMSPGWFCLLPISFLIGLGAIFLSSDLGISSISQIPLFQGDALERELEPLLRKDERTDENGTLRLKIEPHLFAARLVEEPISLPGHLDRVAPGYSTTTTALGLEYVPLQDAEINVAHEVLSATGAIAGFLPRVYGRQRPTSLTVSELPNVYYDAGKIDNTPMAPLLELDLCDVLIVVLLDHRINDSAGHLRRCIDSVNKRVRKANPDISDEEWDAVSYKRTLHPARVSSDNLHDVQLVPIVPSKSLGGFLCGTLRFESSQIEKHMQLGYSDAKVAIDKALRGAGLSSGISTSSNVRAAKP
jgi:predicted acylesterase/phospholipase RssA